MKAKPKILHFLVLVLLILLAACQQDPQDITLDTDIGKTNLSFPNSVLILYTDSSPSFLRAQSASSAKYLMPGVLPERMKESDHEGDHDEPIINTAAIRTQAITYTDISKTYATFIANLARRYEGINVVMQPVSSYQAGQATEYLRTFYMGSTYGDPVPPALIADVTAGAPVTWINYQVWNLDLASLGLSYKQIIPAYTQPLYTTTYNQVDYRGYTFKKYQAPMEIIEVSADRPDVVVHASAKNPAGQTIPYAVQSGNFWYFADLPFAYMHETDRYLIFADLMGPMLGHQETCAPQAVARMEDLNPSNTSAELKRMIDSLNKLRIPFAATVIPYYYNNNTNVTLRWSDNLTALRQVLRIPGLRAGGSLFQHGLTHQYKDLKNRDGETGLDWEFWDANINGPIAGLTVNEAITRITEGKAILQSFGMNPVGWTTPHYAFEPSFGSAINGVFNRSFERRLYQQGDLVAGQFFPYPVKDAYGSLMVPENGGSIQPNYLVSDVLEAARANRVLRCPWFGLFFHPYILDPQYDGANAVSVAQFEAMLTEIKNMGYTFVEPSKVTLAK
ncbi:MAG: DUF2334 domain-containing protein [Trueperaceae bacterium]|nr:DUF2334 domain-containing protein [Trueperaceae bacterium]